MRLLCSDLKYVLFRELFPQITKMVEKAPTGADPRFFLGGVALVSCSTSTPINHIVTSHSYIPAVLENHRSSQRVAHPLTLPLDPPLSNDIIQMRVPHLHTPSICGRPAPIQSGSLIGQLVRTMGFFMEKLSCTH